MSTAEHLAAINKALNEWKPHKDPMKTQWGRVSDADKHLKTIRWEDQDLPEVKKP
jgi:hypothetical protein